MYPGYYYKFSQNGRVEKFSFNYYNSGAIVSGTEKYQYGSYYIDDSEYQNLSITWDNGATEKGKIFWSNGKAGMNNYHEDNCK